MKKLTFTFTIFLIFFTTPLKPILDGRVTPIYLDTRYTFTNFEWAQGRVYFKAGFDLPINGTAILDIHEPIENTISFSNSTLMLHNHLRMGPDSTFTGSGFINADGHTISLSNNLRFQNDELFFFTQSITFEGNGSNYLETPPASGPGGIVFLAQANSVSFVNFELRGAATTTFVTNIGAPSRLNLDNSRITISRTNDFEINATALTIFGTCEILGDPGVKLTIANDLRIQPFAKFIVGNGLEIEINRILSSTISGGIELNSAKISYIPTGTSSLFFTKSTPVAKHQGRLIINGQCELESPVGTELFYTNESIIQFEPGSRLSINPGLKVVIH